MSGLLGPLLLKNRRVWGWFVSKKFQWLHFFFSGSLSWWTAFWVICPWNEFEETEQCVPVCGKKTSLGKSTKKVWWSSIPWYFPLYMEQYPLDLMDILLHKIKRNCATYKRKANGILLHHLFCWIFQATFFFPHTGTGVLIIFFFSANAKFYVRPFELVSQTQLFPISKIHINKIPVKDLTMLTGPPAYMEFVKFENL